ncbi:MAG TPA: pyrroline-5-carboxylate reductase [Thermoanaerobaculia bacterium]|nr:pyrroline-5-carboxylate reductase [Thermoanaerobaculia bacterium]
MEPELELGRLAVVGAGKMGTTLLRAWLGAGVVRPAQVIATARHQARIEQVARELGIEATLDNRQAVASADTILLGVKPQGAAEVLAELAPVLRPGQMVISILASVSTGYIEERLPAPVAVVRVMPNTPSLIGAGMSGVCGGRHAREGQLAVVKRLFESLGRAMVLDEKYFDAVTGLSASGPAFVYIIIESLAEGGVKAGLPRAIATELAAQTCLGAARMVIETGDHPAVLKDAVTTPAGCTIDGILKLEEGGLRVTLIKTVVEATRRAGELVQ